MIKDLSAFNKEEKDLIKICLDQATYFLKDAGEFFPFASGLDQNSKLHPIGVYLENEHPDVKEVLNILTHSISKGISDKKYLFAGICTDVSVNRVINNITQKLNAVEIKIIKSSSNEIVLYFPYEISSNKDVNYGEFFML